jgi:hypothetical protein
MKTTILPELSEAKSPAIPDNRPKWQFISGDQRQGNETRALIRIEN